MDYLTFDELVLCWGHQLEKAHRACKPRTLLVCEFPRELSTMRDLIDDTPHCFSKHGFGTSTALLFSNELRYQRAIMDVWQHYAAGGAEAGIAAVTYLGTESIPDDNFSAAARAAIEYAFRKTLSAKAQRQPILINLTDLVQTQ